MGIAKLNLATWILCAALLIVVLSYPTGGEGNLPPAASQAETTTATAVNRSNARKYDLVFSTYLGGTGTDTIRGVCADKQGNIIVAGGTTSPDFPTTANALSRTYNAGKMGTSTGDFGPMDAFVSKFDSAGHLLWSTYLGGPNYDRAYAVKTDPRGYIYVAGRAGEGFPVTPGAFQPHFVDTHQNPKSTMAYGKQNGFVAKLAPNGKLLWASYVGSGQLCRDIAVDDRGDIYLPSGWNGSGDTPPSRWFAHGFQKMPKGKANPAGASAYVCILKVKSDGSEVLWGTWLNGSGINNIEAFVGVDPNRNVYYADFTSSTDMPLSAQGRKYAGGHHDLYLAKLSPDGSRLLYGTYLGGSGDEEYDTHSLAMDSHGNAYVSGVTSSVDLPVTPGAFQPKHAGGDTDVMIFKVGPRGDLLACTYLGGSKNEDTEGLSVDSAGNVYVSGQTHSPDFPTTSGAYQSAYGNSSGNHDGDGFLTVLSSDLKTVRYSTYMGQQCAVTGQNAYGGFHDNCLGPDGSVVVAGNWFSNLWPTTTNAFLSAFKPGISALPNHAVLASFKPVANERNSE